MINNFNTFNTFNMSGTYMIDYNYDGVIYVLDNDNKILDIIYLSDNETIIFNLLYKNINKLVLFDDSPDMNLLGHKYTSVIICRIKKKISGYFRIDTAYKKGYILFLK